MYPQFPFPTENANKKLVDTDSHGDFSVGASDIDGFIRHKFTRL